MENIPIKLNINKINSDNNAKKHPFTPNNIALKHKHSKSIHNKSVPRRRRSNRRKSIY